MSEVKVIKADEHMDDSNKLLRVAAYCRVSTELDEQDSSFQMQLKCYEEYIKNHEGWKFAGTYGDKASGLTDERLEFQKLLKKCYRKQIDCIVTKSISRFSRNLKDTLNIIQKLNELKINVYFEKEEINTLDSDTQFATSLYALIAQEESMAKGKNIQKGIQYGFISGKSGFANFTPFGYYKGKDGEIEVDEEQSATVRYIYDMFLTGVSIGGIAKELSQTGYLTSQGQTNWSTNQVDTILKNRKYVGDVVLQNTYVENTLTGKRVRNNGKYNKYLIEDHHKGIISLEKFESAQNEFQRRTDISEGSHYSSKPLSGLIYCDCCGSKYGRQTRKDKSGNPYSVWRCYSNLKKDCPKCKESPTILEDDLKKAICEYLGIKEYDYGFAKSKLEKVTVCENGRLNFLKKQ